MTTVVISQPMLFPWPGFFEQLMLADVYLFLDDAQFSKGSFTNRVQLRHGDGRRWMTIPLAGKGSFQPIRDLRASDPGWRAAHRDMLQRSLGDAPHAGDALALLDGAYAYDSICDVLIRSIEASAAYMGIGGHQRRARTSDLGIGGSSWQRVLDLVRSVGGTRYLTGHGAADYLHHEAFEAAGVTVEYMDYSMTKWPRTQSENFTPYVSVLDLVGHTGADARRYLVPQTVGWREFVARREAAGP